MKLKNFLIICLVFSFFMAAAAISAVAADFTAEVSFITDFNGSVNRLPTTKDSDATADVADYSGKAIASVENRDVHISVTGYTHKIYAERISIDYYDAGFLLIAQDNFPSLRNAKTTGCDFTIRKLTGLLDDVCVWIRITVRDQEGNDPVYAWTVYDNSDAGVGDADFTPDATLWDDADQLILCNSLNLTLTSAIDEEIYLWWRESDDSVVAESTELGVKTDLVLPISTSLDPNFTISYSNARYDEAVTPVEVKHAEFRKYFYDGNNLNILTSYTEGEHGTYSLNVPKTPDLDDTILAGASVYYEGRPITLGAIDDTVVIDGYEYYNVLLDEADVTDDAREDWTYNDEKVAVQVQIGDDLYVAGPSDGVGPRLLSASLSYADSKKLTLTFSEPIQTSLINKTGIQGDIDLDAASTTLVSSASASADAPTKIVIVYNRSVEEGTWINLDDDFAETILDKAGNPAYKLYEDGIQVTVERIVEKVQVTGVDLGESETYIQVIFDKSMIGDDVEDPNAYFVEAVDGLLDEDDPDDTVVDVKSVSYTEDNDNFVATLTVDGVIASTAADDLPGVKIVQDIIGGPVPASLRAEDVNKLFESEDEVGPYLVSAVFDYNGQKGKSAYDLVEEEKVTLTLQFSEDVRDAKYEISDDTFNAFGWDIVVLNKVKVSASDDGMVVLTLDDDASSMLDDLPFTSPAFDGDPEMNIARPGDVTDSDTDADDDDNDASDPSNQVEIEDGTKVWVVGARINSLSEIVVEFGKNIAVEDEADFVENKAIAIDGDPNIVVSINIDGSEMTINLDDSVEEASDWTPVVSFDLDDEDNAIKDATGLDKEDNDLTADFSVTAEDNFAPYLETEDGKIKAIKIDEDVVDDETITTYALILDFSEPIDPDVWALPTEAGDYFDVRPSGCGIISFITDGPYACKDDKIGLQIECTDITADVCELQIEFTGNDRIVDMEGIAVTDDNWYPLTAGVAYTGVWAVPSGVDVTTGPVYMKITGVVNDPNGNPLDGGIVYAMSRDNLFTVITEEIDDEEVVTEVQSRMVPDEDSYGATYIQEDGTYYLNVYGGSVGFTNGDAVILVVDGDGSDSTVHYTNTICTTACLSNEDYSVKFKGGYVPTVVNQDLNLGEREVIKLSKGWNLVSTSISTAYVDSEACANAGLDPASFSGYIYGPDEALTGAGSLPATVNTMSSIGSKDISSLLFTIAHPDLENTILAPISMYSIPDRLDDTLNDTPAFGPGLAYYIYIDEEIAADDSDWEIILFGEKVPGPDYKVKVASNEVLVGHWGNLIYTTGAFNPSTINTALLPSTANLTTEFVEDICIGSGTLPSISDVAVIITDSANETVDALTVSSYYRNLGHQGPEVWFGTEDLIDLGDLSVVLPGSGYWIQIDAADGPFFIEYMKPEEEEE